MVLPGPLEGPRCPELGDPEARVADGHALVQHLQVGQALALVALVFTYAVVVEGCCRIEVGTASSALVVVACDGPSCSRKWLDKL